MFPYIKKMLITICVKSLYSLDKYNITPTNLKTCFTAYQQLHL